MTPKTAPRIVSGILEYIRQHGTKRHRWYVGISGRLHDRLIEHGVFEEDGIESADWTFERAKSADTAKNAEKELHAAGCKGAPGGVGDEALDVYAYLITDKTDEGR